MVKGANVGLAALSEGDGSVDAVTVILGWSSPSGDGDADVSVLLLTDEGKVRDNADFFFYNNPTAADGSVQLLGQSPTEVGTEDRIQLDLTAVPDGIERLVIAASRHQRAPFGQLDNLRLELADLGGERLLGFSITDADSESGFVFGEIYRRNQEWKFRAIGQGYDTGLAGLATDFGIEIEDDAAEEAAAERLAVDGADEAAVAVPASGAAAVAAEAEAGGALSAPTAGPTAETQATTPGPVAGNAPAAADAATDSTAADSASAAPKRLRTARKKVTLPKAAKPSLAENDAWNTARLFPATALNRDREREVRATSVLLSVMAQVPEFGRRLTAAFGAPAGRMETFTEVSLPHGETPKRPDGVIRVERAGRLWTALVESKTNGNPLKAEQVQDYMDIAARRGYEAVITLSNDVALEGSPLVQVKIDGRRKHKVLLAHLSWAEVAYQAKMLIRHEGVGNPAHAWLLQELLHYLQHDNSGCHGFQNMGPAWVPVRKGIDDETLAAGDERATLVVESWERLVRQVCLQLGGELGVKVLPVQRTRRGEDARARRTALADRLCADGRLDAEIRIEDAPGTIVIAADLRVGKLRTSAEIPAPEQGYPLSWAKRLVRQLAEAPADLHIETLTDGAAAGPRGTLEKLRPEPGDLLPKDSARITGFRLSLVKGMGSTRGNAESGFIRSVDAAVERFRTGVLVHLDQRTARRA
ncbi:Stress response protein SCP2 [Streptomyces sp. TLI_053]|uniref:TerD family protein n=1 Tax=Streptomyces sp. TLI_053 TaxID=1855352 RepID=UPI00087D3BDE|nr:TerD family protein [Streptomyces sp. TLI_053]SDT82185.1 Stress response protein SCP2 [Streptomyces sp. TLI_053]